MSCFDAKIYRIDNTNPLYKADDSIDKEGIGILLV